MTRSDDRGGNTGDTGDGADNGKGDGGGGGRSDGGGGGRGDGGGGDRGDGGRDGEYYGRYTKHFLPHTLSQNEDRSCLS